MENFELRQGRGVLSVVTRCLSLQVFIPFFRYSNHGPSGLQGRNFRRVLLEFPVALRGPPRYYLGKLGLADNHA